MTAATLTAFWVVSFLCVMTPGADWAYAISAGLRGRFVAPAVCGLLAGHASMALLVAAGVGGLVTRSPFALAVLTLLGAVYLLWLGGNQLFRMPATPTAGADGPASSAQWIRRGFLVSGLNPKVLLLFVALLPQFTTVASPLPLAMQILVLATLHIGTSAVVYALVGHGARAVLAARPVAARIVTRASGAAMACLGLLLIGRQLFLSP